MNDIDIEVTDLADDDLNTGGKDQAVNDHKNEAADADQKDFVIENETGAADAAGAKEHSPDENDFVIKSETLAGDDREDADPAEDDFVSASEEKAQDGPEIEELSEEDLDFEAEDPDEEYPETGDLSEENIKRPKKRWPRLLLIIALAVLAIIIGVGIFYYVSARRLNEEIDSYKESFEHIIECMFEGDYEKLESAGIMASGALDDLENDAKSKKWQLLDFVPKIRQDRENGIAVIDELRVFNDQILWTIISASYNAGISDTKEALQEGTLDGRAVQTISAFTGLIDEIYDPTFKFMTVLSECPEFNISFLEKKVEGYRYPARLILETLPILKKAGEDILIPVSDTISETPFSFPEEISVESLDPDLLITIRTYIDLLSSVYKPVTTFISDFEAIKDKFPDAVVIKEYKEGEKKKIRDKLCEVYVKVWDKLPGVRTTLDSVMLVLEDMAEPVIDTAIAYPFSGLKVDGCYDTLTVNAYLDMAEEIRPRFDEVIENLASIETENEKISGVISKLTSTIEKAGDLYDRAEPYIPLIRAIMPCDGDEHFYLLAAQNSAEIRASGGFPGSIGRLGISNSGLFVILGFVSVWDVLPYSTPAAAGVTGTESALFGGWMRYPRDVDYNPDFPRVAEIWDMSYEKHEGIPIDGIISVTPSVFGRVMELTGPITLSDGTELTPENATRVLQHDLYYKYFGADARSLNAYQLDQVNQMVDSLFSEAASTVIGSMFSKLSLESFGKMLDIIEECGKDRTIMIWMDDDRDQEIVKTLGLDGSLNYDPEDPKVGIYYSCATSSKLGWFVDIDIEMGEARINDDDTRSYDLTVSFTNTIDRESMNASSYIIGTDGGYINSFFHLFAPAGGTISNVRSSSLGFNMSWYKDLQVAYRTNYLLGPGKTVTVTFTVTTAPGVTKVPTISTTPTLQAYR